MLDAHTLRELLDYNPLTGEFHWRKLLSRKMPPGKPAGTIDSKGYGAICINRRIYRAHRLAFLYVYGRWPSGQIDHINCDRTDNRIGNLRECSQTQNNANTAQRMTNKSGIKGVSWAARSGKWYAHIQCGGRQTNLGEFQRIEDAQSAYASAAKAKFGEFARVE